MAEVQASSTEQQQQLGPGGVPKGTKTSDFYHVKDLPARFDDPGKCYSSGNPVFSNMVDIPLKPGQEPKSDELFKGYSGKPVHPVYRTTNSAYGGRAPTVHTMPNAFHAKSQNFSEQLGKCGMYRNHSLNCAMDKSNVSDH